MLQRESIVLVVDNTWATVAKIIGIPGSNKRQAFVGDIVSVAIQKATPSSSLRPGDVAKALIVRTKKEISRSDGSYIRFDTNSAVLINKDHEPIGSRIFGPIARELRAKKFSKIISLAPEVF